MFEVSVKATSTTFLSGSIWPLAIFHCEHAEAEAKKQLGDPIDTEMQHSAGAIILAVTTAEAYINEFLLDPRVPIGAAEIGRSPHDQKFRPKEKWIATMRHATKNDKIGGGAPLQDLGFLIDLRNVLVHYLPEERIVGLTAGLPVPPATKLEDEEARIARFIGHHTGIGARCPNNPILHQLLCGNVARWSVDTVRSCVQQLCDVSGVTAKSWFLP